MKKSNSYWDNRALKRLSDAEKKSSDYIERVKTMYNRAYKNIQNEIDSVYRNYSKETGLDVQKLKELLKKKETDKTWKTLKQQGLDKYVKDNYKSRISRLEQVQAQIYAKAKQIYFKEELAQKMCYKGVINDSYYKAIYDTQMGIGCDFSFHKIDDKLIDSLLSEKWSGKNYSERIWTNTDILANSLSELVGGALLSGQSIEKTSRQLRERFEVSKYYAERLVRTETNYFNNMADAMAYREMGIDKYVFVATLDSRTSPICQSMDNEVFNYKDMQVGVNFPPLHPNCRSKTRGYLGEDVEKTLIRRARNPVTGKNEVIDNISYKDWLKQQGIGVADNVQNVKSQHLKNYEDVTDKWLKNRDLSYQETINAISVIKNEKEYLVNKTNKIEFINREKENGEWFVNTFGGKIEYLPTIQEDGGVSCSDYKYYPKKDNKEWFFLEEKETNGKGKNVFYHALEDKQEQAKIFLIDCTDSNLNDDEIYERINKVFISKETKFVEKIIIKNNDDLFGVFQRK